MSWQTYDNPHSSLTYSSNYQYGGGGNTTPRLRAQIIDPITPTTTTRSTPGMSPGPSPSPSRRTRRPSMSKDPSSFMIPPQKYEHHGRLVVVLDLDETLVYAREGPILPRPGFNELLETLHQLQCEVLVWTAGERDYAQEVIQRIDTHGVVQHCVYRHEKWWSGQAGYRKDIANLGRPMDLILFVDNTPDCLRGHEDNSILVSDFTSRTRYDNVLVHLAQLVRSICNSGMSVPQALARSELVSRKTVRSDVGDHLALYTLVSDTAVGGVLSDQRVNRDLSTYSTYQPSTTSTHISTHYFDSHSGYPTSTNTTLGGGGYSSLPQTSRYPTPPSYRTSSYTTSEYDYTSRGRTGTTTSMGRTPTVTSSSYDNYTYTSVRPTTPSRTSYRY
eukprot:PhF_6_TR34743/c0_g1_i1/m.50566/K15731/CTDSP; carboxy-terminal domain RNA polymerase II polypeptide A small phosphatase